MLYLISYDFRITLKSQFWYETFRFWHYVWNIIIDVYYYVNHKLCYFQTRRHVITERKNIPV